MSRESILKSIKTNKPSLIRLPDIDATTFDEEVDLKETFINNLNRVGGRVVETTAEEIDTQVKNLFPTAKHIVAISGKSSLGNITVSSETDPHNLEHIDLAIIEGQFGVAENGAIWVTENESIVRALPFITNHLIILLPKDQLCLHMLQAYDAIASRERSFGLFISGPSKTADIEQSLVIGAHGAMSLTVFMI
ncbi:MAG: LUD domain-containing protein [Saprospiraceae bacterium]|nr:LUD domain-containing protein [Saprospiraceae bacterium]